MAELCLICNKNLSNSCPECDSSTRIECIRVWGECGCIYHFHCIAKALKKSRFCPKDNEEWEYNHYEILKKNPSKSKFAGKCS
jgi:RING-box protein 1